MHLKRGFLEPVFGSRNVYNWTQNLHGIAQFSSSREVSNMTTGCPPFGGGRQNAVELKFDPNPAEAAFAAVFLTSINADRK